METRYRIIRFYKNGRRKTIKTVSSLGIAKLHCNDPRTAKPGVYFEGFQVIN